MLIPKQNIQALGFIKEPTLALWSGFGSISAFCAGAAQTLSPQTESLVQDSTTASKRNRASGGFTNCKVLLVVMGNMKEGEDYVDASTPVPHAMSAKGGPQVGAGGQATSRSCLQ